MSKVRINDLARELEVKSRAILDTLPLVGVTEKKTHSSSLEEHEAEKVRVYIRSSGEGLSQAGKSSSRGPRGEEEIKTKIDLSHISRPGDVLKAITQRKEVAAPSRPAPTPVAPPAQVAVDHPPVEKTAAPAISINRPLVAPTAPAPPRTIVAAAVERPLAVPPPAAPPVNVSPNASTPVTAPPARPVPPPAINIPSASATAPPASMSAAPVAPRPTAAPPPPRMIVPQTGPRPVYKAPVRPAPPASTVQPGVPIASAPRPAPGRPVPGQPIFQRRPPAAWPGWSSGGAAASAASSRVPASATFRAA
jgi:translation initiation factor IF-2